MISFGQKKIIATLCSITLLLPCNTSPHSIKNILTVSGTALLTALHYSLGYGLNTLCVYNTALPNDSIQSLSDAPEKVQKFIREQLKDTPLKNEKDISIKINPYEHNFFISAQGSKTIIIAGYEKDGKITCQLEQLLEIQEENLKQERDTLLNAYTFFIHHEANHLIHQDTMGRTKFAVALPCIIEGTLFLLKKKFRMPQSLWIKNGLKIPSGIVKATFNFACIAGYTRHCESRADTEVSIDNTQILTDTAVVFRNIQTPPIPYIFSTHPTSVSRAERIEKIVSLLKKQKEEAL